MNAHSKREMSYLILREIKVLFFDEKKFRILSVLKRQIIVGFGKNNHFHTFLF